MQRIEGGENAFLVLGRGRTGSLVAEVAKERGHGVRVVGEEENRNASALTAPVLAGFDAVIDFTTPEAAVQNMRACLATGAQMVVGTTGWYDLEDMKALAERKRRGAAVQHELFGWGAGDAEDGGDDGEELKKAGYAFSIEETHHVSKVDSPSGSAISSAKVVESAGGGGKVPIESKREGDVMGIHTLTAKSAWDQVVVTHEAFSRRGFAEGAVRAAEWLSSRTGCYDFQDVYTEI